MKSRRPGHTYARVPDSTDGKQFTFMVPSTRGLRSPTVCEFYVRGTWARCQSGHLVNLQPGNVDRYPSGRLTSVHPEGSPMLMVCDEAPGLYMGAGRAIHARWETDALVPAPPPMRTTRIVQQRLQVGSLQRVIRDTYGQGIGDVVRPIEATPEQDEVST